MPAAFHSRLPHSNRINAAHFITWRLAGALPTFVSATNDSSNFVKQDRLLDNNPAGPRWLLRNDIAASVRDTLLRGEKDGEYQLGSWVLMPNHVHVIILPHGELARAIQAIKARTAKQANFILGRNGQPFWATDYFDRCIRDRHEEQKIRLYIEQNPVNAGLCERAELWPWSSAFVF